MKPKRLTSMMMMLLFSFGTVAQAQFFDDIYYSADKSKEKQEVESSVEEEQNREEEATEVASDEPVPASSYMRSNSALEEERDVDEYNRRYSDYPEDTSEYADDGMAYTEDDSEPVKTKITVEPERTSDLEYSERIIRYHSPSKISIVGADQVDLYVDDGYYAYDYDTDYSDGITIESVNLNFGSPG